MSFELLTYGVERFNAHLADVEVTSTIKTSDGSAETPDSVVNEEKVAQDLSTATDDAVETTGTLESLCVMYSSHLTLSKNMKSFPLAADTYKFMDNAMNFTAVAKTFGCTVPTVEAFSANSAAHRASVEAGNGNILKRVWESIKNFFKKLWARIKGFGYKLLEMWQNRGTKLDEMLTELKSDAISARITFDDENTKVFTFGTFNKYRVELQKCITMLEPFVKAAGDSKFKGEVANQSEFEKLPGYIKDMRNSAATLDKGNWGVKTNVIMLVETTGSILKSSRDVDKVIKKMEADAKANSTATTPAEPDQATIDKLRNTAKTYGHILSFIGNDISYLATVANTIATKYIAQSKSTTNKKNQQAKNAAFDDTTNKGKYEK